jgi:hypothetical protein
MVLVGPALVGCSWIGISTSGLIVYSRWMLCSDPNCIAIECYPQAKPEPKITLRILLVVTSRAQTQSVCGMLHASRNPERPGQRQHANSAKKTSCRPGPNAWSCTRGLKHDITALQPQQPCYNCKRRSNSTESADSMLCLGGAWARQTTAGIQTAALTNSATTKTAGMPDARTVSCKALLRH